MEYFLRMYIEGVSEYGAEENVALKEGITWEKQNYITKSSITCIVLIMLLRDWKNNHDLNSL